VPFGTTWRLFFPTVKSIRTILIVVLALGLVGETFLVWRQTDELAALTARPGRDDSAQLKAKLSDAQTQLKSLQDQVTALKSRIGGDEDAEKPANADDKIPGSILGSPISPGMQAAMNTLEFQKLLAIEAKAQLDSQYATLFRSLGKDFNLSSDQIDQFKNLLVQKQQAAMDAVQAAGGPASDSNGDSAALRKAVKEAQAIVEDQIKSRLGSAAYAQYRQYERTLPERNVIAELQQSLSYTQAPLTDEQSDQLIPILASTRPRGQGNGTGILTSGGNVGALITNEAVLQAKNVLSQTQFKSFQQLQIAQQARQRLEKIVRAGGQDASGAGSKGPAAP
jgi:hypothetical protein